MAFKQCVVIKAYDETGKKIALDIVPVGSEDDVQNLHARLVEMARSHEKILSSMERLERFYGKAYHPWAPEVVDG